MKEQRYPVDAVRVSVTRSGSTLLTILDMSKHLGLVDWEDAAILKAKIKSDLQLEAFEFTLKRCWYLSMVAVKHLDEQFEDIHTYTHGVIRVHVEPISMRQEIEDESGLHSAVMEGAL